MISEGHHFPLTTDMWSSIDMTPYLSLTVHFINKEWKMVSKCLQTSFFPENHTAENLADALEEALCDWQLDQIKLSARTTDNDNIVAAIRKLDWQWLNSFGHNLNLAVTNALSQERQCTERALGVCHSIIGKLSHSWHKNRDLRKAQQELGLPERSLITVSSQFNSILFV